MRFLVLPKPINAITKNNSMIITDEYSIDEVMQESYIKDIRNDFNDSRLKQNWKSSFAFIYDLDNITKECHYKRIRVSY